MEKMKLYQWLISLPESNEQELWICAAVATSARQARKQILADPNFQCELWTTRKRFVQADVEDPDDGLRNARERKRQLNAEPYKVIDLPGTFVYLLNGAAADCL